MLYDNVKSVRSEWNKLYEYNKKDSILKSFEYVKLWYNCFSEIENIRILNVKNKEKVIGFFPMVLKRNIGLRILSGLTNNHCFLNSQIFLKGHDQKFFSGVVNGLGVHAHEWDVLQLQFRYHFEKMSSYFIAKLSEKFLKNYNITTQPTYSIMLPKSYEEYYNKKLSKRLKKNIFHYSKRIHRKGKVEVKNYRNDEALQHWDEFLRLEDSGWKGEARSSIINLGKHYGEFYRGFLYLLSKHNCLHIYFLSLDNRNIAGVFGFEDGDIFHYAKTGYDDSCREFSLSNLLLVHIIADIIANRPNIMRFHMFPWDYGYKHRFVNQNVAYSDVQIYGRSVRGRLVKLLHKKVK